MSTSEKEPEAKEERFVAVDEDVSSVEVPEELESSRCAES